ncbi:MAG: Rpn family recombination-promoting nuclease/putative transposase [Hespellia sp.]|nr:Rpn family recombination-promoting nuclease/putative transposase [Hespellia sp.]
MGNNVKLVTERPLEHLNLLDDFLMYSVASSSKYGAPFCREMLHTILDRELSDVTIVAQKVYYGSNPEKHGTRLDVYVEEHEDGTQTGAIYDIEPENGDGKKEELPKRVRFYHSKIDVNVFGSGEDYKDLQQVYVIFITSFDPFDRNRMVYTVKNGCVEEPDMPYEDGARTIYLYTRGTEGNPKQELRELLHFIEETNAVNASNRQLKTMQDMVEDVKTDKEVNLMYLKIKEREAEIRKEVAEEKDAVIQQLEEEKCEAERQKQELEEEKRETEQEKQKLEEELCRLKEKYEK